MLIRLYILFHTRVRCVCTKQRRRNRSGRPVDRWTNVSTETMLLTLVGEKQARIADPDLCPH